MEYIIALDQGTTSSRALLVNEKGEVCGVTQEEYPQICPREGWVEHNPLDIWNSQLHVAQKLIKDMGILPSSIKGLGITNQRETTIIWNKHTGIPIYNGIVWQCRRTSDQCQRYKEQGYEKMIRQKTGLVIDAYFSATKIQWILDHVEGARESAEKGDLLFGTVDTWLIWKLTGGEVHATDYTNASRTLLFNIHTLEWDEELLELFHIPKSMLPKAYPSSYPYGKVKKEYLGSEILIAGIAGDQQAALFGQLCFEKGMIKNTYGTGCFLLMNTGQEAVDSKHGLLTTIAWGMKDQVVYALEGSIFMAGATIQWLRDELGIIQTAGETEALALSVRDHGGVYMVPAFQGLGTPYWDMYARAGILGMSRNTKKAHIVRAALESIGYQVKDVIGVMEKDSGIISRELRVDGGAARNQFLLQFQSDLLNIPVLRPHNIEITALGVAYLAGLAIKMWKDPKELETLWTVEKTFIPSMEEEKSRQLYQGWKEAINRVLSKNRIIVDNQ
ncbi:MAG: glycerol kinase GlpK [Epulopiscium sp.]|mgnify:FL=1|nr:glycerol kinase GlpK [Candidatus Epulonipiscium sp.]